MKATKIIIGICLVSLAGLIIYTKRRQKTNRMQKQVADQGYETAHDILFPMRNNRRRIIAYNVDLAS